VTGRPGQDPRQARQAARNTQAVAWPVSIKLHEKIHIFKRKYIYNKCGNLGFKSESYVYFKK
jgi:hypothetical protein